MARFEVHSTLANTTGLPTGIVNHGIISSQEYEDLLSRSKASLYIFRLKKIASATTILFSFIFHILDTKSNFKVEINSSWVKRTCVSWPEKRESFSGVVRSSGVGGSWASDGEYRCCWGNSARVHLPQRKVHWKSNPRSATKWQTYKQKGTRKQPVIWSFCHPQLQQV